MLTHAKAHGNTVRQSRSASSSKFASFRPCKVVRASTLANASNRDTQAEQPALVSKAVGAALAVVLGLSTFASGSLHGQSYRITGLHMHHWPKTLGCFGDMRFKCMYLSW